MRILIADDDSTSRRMLSGILKKSGYSVQEAADGVEAWNSLQGLDGPRLVLLDWVMPRMDGLGVLRKIREAPFELQPYVLMVTSKTEKQDVIAGLEAGANDYVTKPFDLAELRTRVAVGQQMLDAQEKLQEKNRELSRALAEIRTLRGIVPICASCKSIRDDQGFWNQVEVYVRDHSEAEFSHCLCPACMKKLYPDFDNHESADDDRC
jgi:DNA-binding response OmpR family regulator